MPDSEPNHIEQTNARQVDKGRRSLLFLLPLTIFSGLAATIVTAATALILARVFGNSPDFWLNVQRRSDLWEAMHSPRERERIKRARPLGAAA